MNGQCLRSDDMLELLTSERITEENRSRLFRINAHLMQCDSCGESYQKLVKLFDIVEGWSLRGQFEAEQKLQHIKTCLALIRTQKQASPSLSKRIDRWLKNFIESSVKIVIHVRNGIRMTVDPDCLFVPESTRMNFGYATFSAARGEPPKIDLSLLLDKNDALNSIKIDGQRSVRVSLDGALRSAPLVALISRDTTQAATVVELSYDGQQNLWSAQIDSLQDGEYDLIIEMSDREQL